MISGRRSDLCELVSQVDEDGNEVAGIRLPPIAVPLGTPTGWNVYPADFAAASALVQQRLLLPEDAARYVDAATREPALA